MCNLQMSQVEFKETYERHGKLLIEILQRLENLYTVENLIRHLRQTIFISIVQK